MMAEERTKQNLGFLAYLEEQYILKESNRYKSIYVLGEKMYDIGYTLGVIDLVAMVSHSESKYRIKYILSITKFIKDNNPEQLFAEDQESLKVFELFEKISEVCKQKKRNKEKIKRYSKLLKQIGMDAVLNCFVVSLRTVYDQNDEIWNTYRLTALFKNSAWSQT